MRRVTQQVVAFVAHRHLRSFRRPRAQDAAGLHGARARVVHHRDGRVNAVAAYVDLHAGGGGDRSSEAGEDRWGSVHDACVPVCMCCPPKQKTHCNHPWQSISNTAPSAEYAICNPEWQEIKVCDVYGMRHGNAVVAGKHLRNSRVIVALGGQRRWQRRPTVTKSVSVRWRVCDAVEGQGRWTAEQQMGGGRTADVAATAVPICH